MHLLLNMYALYLFGPLLEAALGRVRFTALYLCPRSAAARCPTRSATRAQPSLGASGAVFGLLGAFLVVNRRLGRDNSAIMVLLAINLAYGFLVPQIDWRAHLGGLVTGALVAAAIAYAPSTAPTAGSDRGTVATLLGRARLLVVVAHGRPGRSVR